MSHPHITISLQERPDGRWIWTLLSGSQSIDHGLHRDPHMAMNAAYVTADCYLKTAIKDEKGMKI